MSGTENKKMFRSLIKKYFPAELCAKLDIIANFHGMDNNSKTDDITSLLREYNVPYSPLGNGTNRYGILVDGYAVKIALDRMGKIDNKREFKYTKVLYPDVVKVYECCETGLIAVTEYITIFSLDDFYDNQERMRDILKNIAKYYLVGDIGISSNNYVNWGTRSDGSIAILDFAYIYSLSYKGFLCTCEDEGTLEFDKDYNYLQCPFCRRKWSFGDIRKRITKQDEINEIGDITEIGYNISQDGQLLKVNPRFTIVEEDKPKKVKVHIRDKVMEKSINTDFSAEDQEKYLEQINNLLYK